MNHQLNELRGLEHAWIGKMKGSIAQNIDYCSKETELLEFGTRPHYSGILIINKNFWKSSDTGRLFFNIKYINEKKKNFMTGSRVSCDELKIECDSQFTKKNN